MHDLIRASSALGWLKEECAWMAACDRAREEDPPEEASVQDACDTYRYEHDLLTAEETEEWLEGRELTMEEFQVHGERLAVASRVPGPPASADDAAGAWEMEFDEEELRVHLWLSGKLESLARRCAWLVAAAVESGEVLPGSPPDVEVWRGWERLVEERTKSLLASSEALRVLKSQSWPLTRVTLEIVEFEDESVAREAELCAQEGSADLQEIARETGARRKIEESLVRDLPDEWQGWLMSLPPGGVVRLPAGDTPSQLVRVLAKREPTLEDEDSRRLVAQRLQENCFGEAERRVIEWVDSRLRSP
jgi:hypothetical protein